jgi:hypothetical protein
LCSKGLSSFQGSLAIKKFLSDTVWICVPANISTTLQTLMVNTGRHNVANLEHLIIIIHVMIFNVAMHSLSGYISKHINQSLNC